MEGVFARIVCADDGTAAAGGAAALAQRLAAPGARFELVPVERHVRGRPDGVLVRELARAGATLAVVAAPAHSRAVGIASGAVSTFVLHEAPCSVLVARPQLSAGGGGIVVGVDGSPESALAFAAARRLAARLGLPLRAVAATRAGNVDVEAARATAPTLEEQPRDPVDLLAHLSEDADLLVVGSRGLRGVRSLGSVSERVAHEARCPVLVVRTSPAASAAA